MIRTEISAMERVEKVSLCWFDGECCRLPTRSFQPAEGDVLCLYQPRKFQAAEIAVLYDFLKYVWLGEFESNYLELACLQHCLRSITQCLDDWHI